MPAPGKHAMQLQRPHEAPQCSSSVSRRAAPRLWGGPLLQPCLQHRTTCQLSGSLGVQNTTHLPYRPGSLRLHLNVTDIAPQCGNSTWGQKLVGELPAPAEQCHQLVSAEHRGLLQWPWAGEPRQRGWRSMSLCPSLCTPAALLQLAECSTLTGHSGAGTDACAAQHL